MSDDEMEDMEQPESPPERPSSREERDEETLARIVESLGGASAVEKLKLRVQKREKGQGWKSIRPIPIEDWMVKEDMNVPEVIGETYGDGFYRWQLRHSGKYMRSGDCQLEGYQPVSREAMGFEEPEPEPQGVDLAGVMAQLKAELLTELKPFLAPPPAPLPPPPPQQDLAQALRVAVEPLARVLEAKISAPLPAPPPPAPSGPDPTVTALIGLFTQQLGQQAVALREQNQTLTGLFSKMAETRPSSGLPVSELREIIGLAQSLVPQAAPAPEPTFVETEEPPEVAEPQPATTGLFGAMAQHVEAAAGRIAQALVKKGEEKFTSELLSLPAGEASASAPAPATVPAQANPSVPLSNPLSNPAGPASFLAQGEGLFNSVAECLRVGVTPEEFLSSVVPELPPEVMGYLRNPELTPARIADYSQFLGKPQITERIKAPDFQEYLQKILDGLRAGGAA